MRDRLRQRLPHRCGSAERPAIASTQFEVFHSNHRWRAWLRIVDEHGNGEVLFSTPRGYATKSECINAIELVMRAGERTPIVFLSQGDPP
jgi:uncharacterized protein YegP (UPF0339 family)